MNYIWCLFLISMLGLLVIFQVCQFETYETYNNNILESFEGNSETAGAASIINSAGTNVNNQYNSSDNMLDEKARKNEILLRISDKLAIINKKMNQFDDVKPIKQSVYRNLFEKQLPAYMDKNRGSKTINKHIFDVSQSGQDQDIKRLETNLDKLVSLYKNDLGEDDTNIKSVKSHINGQNINLMGQGEYYSIPINNGCLFVVNDKTGEVNYDITNINRSDKNKICLDGQEEQHFKLQKIDNLAGYQEMVGSTLSDGPMDGNSVAYPFYVLKPRNFENQCLESNDEGVHIEQCKYKKSQRWEGYQINRPC